MMLDFKISWSEVKPFAKRVELGFLFDRYIATDKGNKKFGVLYPPSTLLYPSINLPPQRIRPESDTALAFLLMFNINVLKSNSSASSF